MISEKNLQLISARWNCFLLNTENEEGSPRLAKINVNGVSMEIINKEPNNIITVMRQKKYYNREIYF